MSYKQHFLLNSCNLFDKLYVTSDDETIHAAFPNLINFGMNASLTAKSTLVAQTPAYTSQAHDI